jgi:hypothetical protein
MAEPIQISVERIGNKVAFQIDPEAIVRPGCSCSSCSNRQFSLEELVRASAPSQT